MKQLINDEKWRRPSSQRNGPSVVARLMGIDALHMESKSRIHTAHVERGPTRTHTSYSEKNLRSPIIHGYSNSSFLEREFNHVYDHTDLKPRRREHPQEEELQKFKKEFEAWQAAMSKEQSRCEEMETASIRAIKKKYVELNGRLDKVNSYGKNGLSSYEEKSDYAVERMEFTSLPCGNRYGQNGKVPTTIVVLKPGPEMVWSSEDSRSTFSGCSEDPGRMEDFLEEVKERLKHELQGRILQKGPVMCENGRVGTIVINKGSEDPKRIVKQTSYQSNVTVTREPELGSNLVQSESTRLQKGDIRLKEMGTPEFIHRDLRKFLAKRLKNVLRRESDINIPIGVNDNLSRSSLLDEIVENGGEIHTRESEPPPPNSLVCSLSVPTTGASFGELLLEDHHVIMGAHSMRKHDHSTTKKVRKEKERSSLREKVHNLGSIFTLRGRLFGKRVPSMADLSTCEASFMKDVLNGPTVISDSEERYWQENSAEVPPSPASACSSNSNSNTPEEFWRVSNDLSLVPSPEATSQEEADEIHVSREITPACNVPQMQLIAQTTSERPVEDGRREHKLSESKLPELEDGIADYVRALLVASGLYDGIYDPCMSGMEPLARPITSSVYEEVEESYKQHERRNGLDRHSLVKDDDQNGIEVDHKLLYNLSNEALSNMLGLPSFSSSRFKEKMSDPSDLPHLQGHKLMDSLWRFIHPLVYPPGDDLMHNSLDSIVARDLESGPWFLLLGKHADTIGSYIEGSILSDLIIEFLGDIKLLDDGCK